jgi:hypothetical protein
MNKKRYFIGSLLVWFYIIDFDFVFHGIILKNTYLQLTPIVRPLHQFPSYFYWTFVGQFLLSFVFCYIYVKGFAQKGLWGGIWLGLLVGAGFGISSDLIRFAIHPFPSSLIIAWAAGYLVELMIAGMIISFVYKPLAAE